MIASSRGGPFVLEVHMRYTLLAIALALGTAVTLNAKGPTVKLTITGPNLAGAIEVTTPKALAHVWSDDFLGPLAEEPSAAFPRYTVQFHVLPNGKREIQVMYAVTYVTDPRTGAAFVYLPAPGEEHYSLNISTILREGGRWHRAVPTWAAALNVSLRSGRADGGRGH
jgi:hypothetical protein